MKIKKVAFAGFLDGYKAQNVATAASSIDYHFDEMKIVVTTILSSQRKKMASDEISNSLNRIREILSTYDGKDDNFFHSAISVGTALKTIILISKENSDPSSLLSEEKIKRLIYHYIELAELSEDKEITDLAISIAEMF